MAAGDTVGYSGTPLSKKLGIVADCRLAVIDGPDGLTLALPGGVTMRTAVRGPLDVCVFFTTSAARLDARWPKLTASMTPSGGLWVAWPKRSSGVPTDITEQTLRDLLLPTGWVDNKVCAIDATWSGLRFVLRKELRPKGA
ncbi:MAG: DUF3052 domain-containing protein [Acidimicrobiia bacterium]